MFPSLHCSMTVIGRHNNLAVTLGIIGQVSFLFSVVFFSFFFFQSERLTSYNQYSLVGREYLDHSF